MMPWLPMILGGVWGLALGLAFFLGLRVNTRLYLENGPLWQPLALMLGRIALAVGGLAVLLGWGWPVVLAGLAGFTLARPLVRPQPVMAQPVAPQARTEGA